MQTVVRRGRVKGLTSWLISQRPAALSKAVLSQVDGLVAFRLTASQARVLIESIDTSTLVGLRDRALIGVMTYAFARIGAVVSMRVEDYFANGKRWWVRLHEKGGKRHEMPAHHKLEAFLDEYLRTAGIAGDERSPLFRSAVRCTGTLAATAMHRVDAWRMIQDRKALGLWIEGQADRDAGKALLGSLPEKQKGQAVVWLPARGILDDVTFPQKLT
jgi:site-specific recombinase XerC